MKDITSKELKELTGMNNMEILNAISLLYSYLHKENKAEGYDALAQHYKEEGYKFHDILSKKGLYD